MIELTEEDYKKEYRLYKHEKTDKVWWVDHVEYIGEYMFTFDKKTVYHLFGDYPSKLTKEQKELFDKENPYWVEFFEEKGSKNINYSFPFGQPIIPVRQIDNGQTKQLFILGVYASAVHVKWIGPDGKIRIRAMAVASEPEIFWRGDIEYVKNVIERINLDSKYGHLEPADQSFNGPSGKCLDDNYIHPLGLSREDVWLCDLLPESRKNPSQEEALKKKYDRYVSIPYDFPPVPKPIANEQRVEEIVKELESSGAQKIILLGDEPIKYFLNHFDKSINKLSDICHYGEERQVTINKKIYQVICLAHPRQTAKLGKSSEKWYNEHQTWIKEINPK